jgi:hypothetical protein
MWDSGLRPTPGHIVERARAAVSDALRDRELLTLPELASELRVHVRTLQAAARTGRLEVQYSARSVFGRPLRFSSRAAGKAFLRDHYKRYVGQSPGGFSVPGTAPAGFQRQLRELRRHLRLSQADLAELIGAANRDVVYQWESSKRVPSPVFWERIAGLCPRASHPLP